MRVYVFSFLPTKKIKKILLKNGFTVSSFKPDIIVSYGGDGTFLTAERSYPSIPKLIVKKEKKVKDFEILEAELAKYLPKLKKGLFKIVEFDKVEAIFKNKRLVGINEVQIRNKLPIEALRFNVSINEKKFENVIADGMIVATLFGSTGYYSSAGGKKFKRGLGLCFNNPHNIKIKSIILNGNEEIKVKILRGMAYLASDNNPMLLNLKEGDEVLIRKSEEKAKIIKFRS
ncbi:MAG: hypothetical protein ACP5H3_00035 [Candidatus Aenigmatarchaeota archaeon]|jgi:NAD+ kinase